MRVFHDLMTQYEILEAMVQIRPFLVLAADSYFKIEFSIILKTM